MKNSEIISPLEKSSIVSLHHSSKSSKLNFYLKEYISVFADVGGLVTIIVTLGLYLNGIITSTILLYSLLAVGVVIFTIFSFQLINTRKLLKEVKTLLEIGQANEQYKQIAKYKFKDVGVDELSGVVEFNYQQQARVKKQLIDKVEYSVFATHLVDIDLPKPLENEDEINYFRANIKALDRIKENKGDGINRFFLISNDVLENKSFCDAIKSSIQRHIDEGFNIKLALYQKLSEPISFDFAIYDDLFVFRLSVNSYRGDYGSQNGYFDPNLVNIYKKRWINIESQSLTPNEFWERYYNC